MLQVQLQYGTGTPVTRNFSVYSADIENVGFKNILHNRLNGGYVQNPVGYWYKGSIEFASLDGDKSAVYWMEAFSLGTARKITFTDLGGAVYTVSLDGTSLDYTFYNGVNFANGFTLSYTENILRQVADDGLTRKIVCTQNQVPNTLSGDTLTAYVNIVDESTIQVNRKQWSYIDGTSDDSTFSFVHKLTIDFDAVINPTQRAWLRDFCLWGLKQIDTTHIDSANGKVYNVVFGGTELVWTRQGGIYTALATKLIFLESTARTVAETYNVPVYDNSRYDEVRFDEKVFS